jgi:hypothetical protein
VTLSGDLEAKLVTGETSRLNSRFFELSEFTDQLDSDELGRLLRRWEGELADFSSAFIGRSLESGLIGTMR